MEQPPALSPQELAAAQASAYHQLGQPQSVLIFGIFHLLLAAYGLVTSVFAAYVMFVGNPFLSLMPKNPAMAAQAELQAEMQQKVMPASIITTALTILLAVLLIIAGIKLVKNRRGGLKWSNRYAWTSLVCKGVNLILAFMYTFPMMNEMTERMSRMSGSGPPMPVAMNGIVAISAALTILVMCAYPVLVLILLNRPRTKEWFAAQPE